MDPFTQSPPTSVSVNRQSSSNSTLTATNQVDDTEPSDSPPDSPPPPLTALEIRDQCAQRGAEAVQRIADVEIRRCVSENYFFSVGHLVQDLFVMCYGLKDEIESRLSSSHLLHGQQQD